MSDVVSKKDLLRDVLVYALERAAAVEHLPKKYNFLIKFKTKAPGVIIPADVAASHPEIITISINEAYKNLKLMENDEFFAVTLVFGQNIGQRWERILVPLNSVVGFLDQQTNYRVSINE